MILQGRKAYQADGTVPDWAALEAMIGPVRTAHEKASTDPPGIPPANGCRPSSTVSISKTPRK